jgi:Rrf2 family protein
MSLFTSKVDYAMRALVDLAAGAPTRPAQSREIASRQDIPESYLNQLLVVLRRAGLVRSVRGAAGGYVLGREPHQITTADVVCALHGSDILGEAPDSGSAVPSAWVMRNLHSRLNEVLRRELQATTLSDLLAEVQRLDETQSLMLGL